MLDIYEMQIFLAAADTGSFSEAGRRLQMSQPAVSMQIRSLEKRLNVELFSRAGRHISLTEIGQALVPMARELVNHAIRVHEAVMSMKGEVVGMLKLACSTTAGKYILPKLIAGFIDRYPAVQVVCQVGTRGSALQMLLDGAAQIAITSLREPNKELDYRPFITEPVILIAPMAHPWAARESIMVEDLKEARFIHRELSSGTQQTVIEGLAEYGIGLDELPTAMVLGNSEAIHIAVTEGIGVAFISRRAALEGIRTGKVAEVKIEGLSLAQQLYMVRRANREHTISESAFWEYVYSSDNQNLLEYFHISDSMSMPTT